MTVLCPTCGCEVPGLLAGCDTPECRTAHLDYDAAIDRRTEI